MLSRVKKSDQVIVISGKDKGKQGKVLDVQPKDGKVKVQGIAVKVHYIKARSSREPGKMLRAETFIPLCKVMPVCPTTKKPCRVQTEVLGNGTKIRVSHRSKEAI